MEKRIIQFSDFKLSIFFLILFLALRIFLLTTYQGILGSDEDFSFLVTAGCFFKKASFCIPDHIGAYNYFNYILQSIITIPFYFIFGDSDFSFYSCAIFLSSTTLITLYFYLKRIFSKSLAILGTLTFILTPIGLSLFSSAGGGYPGRQLYLLTFILLLFFIEKQKYSIKSVSITLIILILNSPSFIFLSPLFFFLGFKNFNKDQIKNRWVYIPSILFSVFLVTFSSYSAYEKFFMFFKKFNFSEIDFIFNKLFTYFIRPFIGGSPYRDAFSLLEINIPNRLSEISGITQSSLFLFFILFLYSLYSYVKKKKNQIEESIILYSSVLLIIFNIIYFLFKFYLVFGEMRPLSGLMHYIHFSLYLITIFIALNIHSNLLMRSLFYSYLCLNLIINVYTIAPSTQNNFEIYQLGSNYSEIKVGYFPFSRNRKLSLPEAKKHLKIVEVGRWAREIDPLIINSIYTKNDELQFFGLGLKFYFGNKEGINFCKILRIERNIKLCSKGYTMGLTDINSLFKGTKNEKDSLISAFNQLSNYYKGK